MKIVLNATPVAGLGGAFYTFLRTAMRQFVKDPALEKIWLELTTIKSIQVNAHWTEHEKVELIRRILPARLLEEATRLLPGFSAKKLYPQADLYWNPHHMFYCPLDSQIPYVVSVHSVSPLAFPEHVSKQEVSLYRKRFERTKRHANLVHVVSQTVGNELIELCGYNPELIRVCHNAVDPRFKPVKSGEDFLDKKYQIDRPYVLCVGSISPRKNQISLVRIWNRICAETGMDVLLVLAGKFIENTEAFESAISQSGCPDRIRILNQVPHLDGGDDLLYLYSNAVVYVHPSYHEGCCLSLMEAVACGTPVACSAIDSHRECMQDAAAYFDHRNLDDIVRVVSELLIDESERKRLNQAALKALERHSGERFGRCMSKIFEEASSL